MKKQSIFLVIIAALFAVVYFYSFDSKLDLNGDNANYIRLARNMSTGLGYSFNTAQGVEPTNFYPPAYPAFLSVFMSMGISSLIFFKLLDGLFLFLSIAGLFYLLKRLTLQDNLALVVAVMTIISPQILHFSCIVMSEMFYLFTSVVCFVSLYKYSTSDKTKFWQSPYFYLAIISAALSYYIRTVGTTVIFSMLVFFLFRKEWKAAGASAVSIVALLLPWSLRNSSLGLESRYLGTIMTINPWRPEEGTVSSVGDMIDKMLLNFDEIMIKGIKEILFPFLTIDYEAPSSYFAIIMGVAVIAVIFYGAWNMNKLKWVFVAYMLSSIGLLLLWHGGNGSRYLVPIAPVLFMLFYLGLISLARRVLRLSDKVAAFVPFGFLIVVLMMIPPMQMLAKMSKEPYPPAYTNYFEIAKVMHEKAPKNSIVCCRKPELFMYYAPNIFCVNYIYTPDAKALITDLVKKNVEYVVLEQLGYGSTGRYLYPAIQQYMQLFQMVWQLPEPDTYLLRFDRVKAKEILSIK